MTSNPTSNKLKLKDFGDILSGFAFDSSRFNDKQGTPIVRIRDIKTSKTSTYYDGDFDRKYLIKNGDYLIGMDGEFNIKEWTGGEALLNQRTCKLILNPRKVHPRYIYYLMPRKLKEIESKTPYVTVKHISTRQILYVDFFIPPLPTQQKIASILEKAESAREKRREANRLTDEFLKSAFLEMFGDPIRNPEGWEKCKMSEMGTVERGISKHRPRNATELLGGPYPLIQTGDIAKCNTYIKEHHQTYSEIGLRQSKLWRIGTLCITIAANISKTGILMFKACFPDSVVGFTPNKKVKAEYIHFYFLFYQKILEDLAPESAQKNINLQILRNLDIPIPPIQLQQKFANLVQKVERLKEKQSESETELNNLFNSLLQRAFRGEMS